MEITLHYQSKEAFKALQLYVFSKGIAWSSGDTEPMYVGEANDQEGYIQLETGGPFDGCAIVMHLAVGDGRQLCWEMETVQAKAAIERVIMRSNGYKSPEKRVRTLSTGKRGWYDMMCKGTSGDIFDMYARAMGSALRQRWNEPQPRPVSPPLYRRTIRTERTR